MAGVNIRTVNPLRRALLGPGQLPVELRAALAAEKALVLEEGLTGSVTFRNYHATSPASQTDTTPETGQQHNQ
jgi:hypothetical protein